MTVMKRRLRAKVWWPKIDTEAERIINKCKGCILTSIPSVPEPMKTTPLPSKPWQHLAVDYLGPLPSGHNLLVLVDYYSRYIEIEIMKKNRLNKNDPTPYRHIRSIWNPANTHRRQWTAICQRGI